METQVHELVGAVHDAAWQPWAVQYFFLIAISVTALLVTLPAFVFGKSADLRAARLALMVAVTTARSSFTDWMKQAWGCGCS